MISRIRFRCRTTLWNFLNWEIEPSPKKLSWEAATFSVAFVPEVWLSIRTDILAFTRLQTRFINQQHKSTLTGHVRVAADNLRHQVPTQRKSCYPPEIIPDERANQTPLASITPRSLLTAFCHFHRMWEFFTVFSLAFNSARGNGMIPLRHVDYERINQTCWLWKNQYCKK